MFLKRVAILVDDAFFLRRAKALFGLKLDAPQVLGEKLISYCMAHASNLTKKSKKHFYYEVAKIFVYECPPLNKRIYHPLLNTSRDLKNTITYSGMTEYLEFLRSQRRVALRLGTLLDSGAEYRLKPKVFNKLLRREISLEQLTEEDFNLDVKQKGVDMKIAVDIACLSYKRQVDTIILIAGDSDFVPAAKLARSEGVDFILDPMWHTITPLLNEHVDGIMSACSKPNIK